MRIECGRSIVPMAPGKETVVVAVAFDAATAVPGGVPLGFFTDRFRSGTNPDRLVTSRGGPNAMRGDFVGQRRRRFDGSKLSWTGSVLGDSGFEFIKFLATEEGGTGPIFFGRRTSGLRGNKGFAQPSRSIADLWSSCERFFGAMTPMLLMLDGLAELVGGGLPIRVTISTSYPPTGMTSFSSVRSIGFKAGATSRRGATTVSPLGVVRPTI